MVDDSVNVRLGDGANSNINNCNINNAAMLDTSGDSNIKDSIASALTKIKKLDGLCKVACLLLLCIVFVLLLLLCAILVKN